MPTFKEVRQAVATTLSNGISGANVYPRIPGSIVAPAVLVLPVEANYQTVMNNKATEWQFDLVVLGGIADDAIAQDVIDDFVDATGDKSIKAAIHAASGLGRTDVSATVRGMSNYGIRYQVGQTDYIGATLRLYVIAKNT